LCVLSLGAAASACVAGDEGADGARDVGADVGADSEIVPSCSNSGRLAVSWDGGNGDFGSIAVGASVTRTVIVRNDCDGPLQVSQLGLFSGSQGFRLEGDNFAGAVLGPEGTVDDLDTEAVESDRVEIPISFVPDSAGPNQGVLLVYSDDPDEPEFREDLTGTGVAVLPGAMPAPLYVELEWDSSAYDDAEPAADLDLHVVRGEGCYGSAQSFYSGNTEVDWATAGSPAAPVFFEGARGGRRRAEGIGIDEPETGVYYRFGVNVAAGKLNESVPVVARVFLYGTLALERELTLKPPQFWEFTAALWPAANLVELGREYASMAAACE
jgi:hypothetical protein